MPWCRIGSGAPFVVDNSSECIGGSIVAGPDAGPVDKDKNGTCFIRSVLTRGLGELILDLGVSDKIGAQLVRNVDIPREPVREGRLTGRKFLALTAARRLRLATRVMRSILKLAATYRTGLDFRVQIFLETPRGRQILRHYEHYLPEIYEIARNDYTLLNDLASAWLEVRPFVAAMVAVQAGADKAPRDARRHALSKRSYDHGQNLIRRFGEGASDPGFRGLTRELASELAQYRGLNAEQALAKVRASPATRTSGRTKRGRA